MCISFVCMCLPFLGKSFYNVKQLTPYENFEMCFHHICMNCTQFIFCITLNIFKQINSTWLIRNSLQGFCFMHVTFYLEIIQLLKATTKNRLGKITFIKTYMLFVSSQMYKRLALTVTLVIICWHSKFLVFLYFR